MNERPPTKYAADVSTEEVTISVEDVVHFSSKEDVTSVNLNISELEIGNFQRGQKIYLSLEGAQIASFGDISTSGVLLTSKIDKEGNIRELILEITKYIDKEAITSIDLNFDVKPNNTSASEIILHIESRGFEENTHIIIGQSSLGS